jgi:hypothetical protein
MKRSLRGYEIFTHCMTLIRILPSTLQLHLFLKFYYEHIMYLEWGIKYGCAAKNVLIVPEEKVLRLPLPLFLGLHIVIAFFSLFLFCFWFCFCSWFCFGFVLVFVFCFFVFLFFCFFVFLFFCFFVFLFFCFLFLGLEYSI